MSDGGRRARAYILEGRVQGVGFRAYIRRQARDLGVSGWTRNEPDGTVAVEAAAEPETLGAFEERLRKGPPAGRVERLRSEELDRPSLTEGFEIRF